MERTTLLMGNIKQLEVIVNESSNRESESEVKCNKVLYEAKLVSAEDPSEEPKKRPDLSDIDERRYSSFTNY